jgi:hypothetical protein
MARCKNRLPEKCAGRIGFGFSAKAVLSQGNSPNRRYWTHDKKNQLATRAIGDDHRKA